jgi:hypothetical protein
MKRVMDLSFPVWSRLSLVICAIVMILPLSQIALAQQSTAKQLTPSVPSVSHPKAEQTERASRKTAKPGHEGIAVHGHWVIDVRNPDGSLAQHREFENSLVNGGPQVLSQMLAGAVVPGNWSVLLGPASGNGPCSNSYTLNGTSDTSENCEVVQSLTTAPAFSDCKENLCAASLTLTGPLTTTILLSGTITSNQTGSIGVVSTEVAYCISPTNGAANGGAFTITPTPYTVSPSACVTTATQAVPFTSTTLTTVLKPGATPTPNPIPVTAGQTILASVTISFS